MILDPRSGFAMGALSDEEALCCCVLRCVKLRLCGVARRYSAQQRDSSLGRIEAVAGDIPLNILLKATLEM